jgi:hypothetical protein
MAPEQFLAEPTDHRADIFAFSVALYAALYRERPFAGATFRELQTAVLEGVPRQPPPGAAVPPWLRAVLSRGLARRPCDRPASIDALLHALTDDPDERARLRWRRLALAILISLAAWLLGVFALWAWGAWQRAEAERLADRRLAAALIYHDEQLAAGDPAEAQRSFTAFVEHPDNRGTAALGRAWLHRARAAQSRGELDPTIDAFATAYTLATAEEDRRAALLSLAQIFAGELRWPALQRALVALGDRAAAPPGSIEAELHHVAALAGRDLAAAVAHLAAAAPPASPALPVLRAISAATATDHHHRGYAVISDLDGDGRRELVFETNARARQLAKVVRADLSLTPLTTVDLGVSTFRALPAGDARPGLLLSTGPAPARDAVLSQLRGDHLVELFRWPEGQIRAALSADLDGDGRPELLVGAGPYARRLTELVQETDGSWSTRSPAPALDRRRSDVVDLLAGDLDGDGRPELVAALGPWIAYELHVLRHDPARGQLTTVTRRRLGNIAGAALVRGHGELHGAPSLEIAVSKTDQYPSTVVFPRDRPYGDPAGLYLFRLDEGALVQTAFAPAPRLAADEFTLDGPPIIGDLDGDGSDEIILCRTVSGARTSIERDNTVIFTRGADDALISLTLGDLRPIAALDLDGDGDDELLVSDSSEGARDRLWILGSGHQALPKIDLAPPAAAPLRAPDPLLDLPLRRAERLANMGLLGQAAANLSTLASWILDPQLRARIELRAAQLYESQGADASAAPLYASAARGLTSDPRAREGAARSELRLGHVDAAAAHLASDSAAAPDLRAAVDALRRGPALDLTFDRPLAPTWRIGQPLALHRDGGQGTFNLDALVPGEIASAPLRRAGGDLLLGLDLHVSQIEWGGHLSLGLTREDDRGALLSVELTTTGGGNERVHEIGCAFDGVRVVAKLPFDIDDPRELLGNFQIRAARLATLGEATCEVLRGDGEPLLYRRIPLQSGHTSAPLRLTIADNTAPSGWSWVQAELRRLHLRGAELDTDDRPQTTPTELLHARHRFIEGDLLGALTALAAAPRAPADHLLAVVALARLGRWDEAERALSELLASEADADAINLHLDALLRTDPELFGVLLRRALGPQIARQRLSCAWTRAALGDHSPRAYAVAWTALAERDLDADSPDILRLHAEAAAALGHYEAADASFAAALRAQGRPYEPCGYGRTPALDRLEINLGYAALALARGDEPAARRLLAPDLRGDDPDPYVAERLRARDDLRPLWDLIPR